MRCAKNPAESTRSMLSMPKVLTTVMVKMTTIVVIEFRSARPKRRSDECRPITKMKSSWLRKKESNSCRKSKSLSLRTKESRSRALTSWAATKASTLSTNRSWGRPTRTLLRSWLDWLSLTFKCRLREKMVDRTSMGTQSPGQATTPNGPTTTATTAETTTSITHWRWLLAGKASKTRDFRTSMRCSIMKGWMTRSKNCCLSRVTSERKHIGPVG